MSSTEAVMLPAIDGSPSALAHALFDDVITPAAAERKDDYFPLIGEPQRTTYFLQPNATQLTLADFAFPGDGDGDGLIDALVEQWTKDGDNRLATSGEQLKQIIAALRAEALESEGDVDPYCYTMF